MNAITKKLLIATLNLAEEYYIKLNGETNKTDFLSELAEESGFYEDELEDLLTEVNWY